MIAGPIRERDLQWTSSPDGEHLMLCRMDQVVVVRMNRPEVRNALSHQLMTDLMTCLEALSCDAGVRIAVLTGGERVFAAGADIGEMAGARPLEMHEKPRLEQWQRLRRLRLPLVAAVNGYALGGGCELAMACDIIVAGEGALFGQPEVRLGLIPGGGGTQRLVRAVGKARAMDLILTGGAMPASVALQAGLVSRVVPDELCLDEAIQLARQIADHPRQAVLAARDAVLHAFDLPIESGLDYERRLFELLFDSADTQEGLRAFLEKRPPEFGGNQHE
jgi:enoyl-CoA hydratase